MSAARSRIGAPMAARVAGVAVGALLVVACVGAGASPPPAAPSVSAPPTTEPTGPTTTRPTSVTPTTASPTTAPPTTALPATTLPATTLPAVPVRLTMAFTGDIVPHRAVNRGATQPDGSYDYTAMFSRLQPMLDGADLAVCHLEAPVAPPGEEVLIAPMRLSVAAEIAPAIAAAGYDRCSTASNHSLDRGHAGIDATVDALEAAGVPQSGMARTPQEVLPALVEVNGVQVAHLSYTFSFNGLQFAAGEEWRSNVIEPTRIIADATTMRVQGAQVVVVSLHWGVERGVQPTTFQRDVAQQLTASGQIDLIVGHHAHVLQPIEQVNGVWVVWGMGNVLSDHPTSSQWPATSQDAAVVTVAMQIAADGAVAVEAPVVHPTWCDRDHGYIIRFTSEADDPTLSEGVRQALRQSEQRTRDLLGEFMVPPATAAAPAA